MHVICRAVKRKTLLAFAAAALLLSACTKDRTFTSSPGGDPNGAQAIAGALAINELVATGSTNANEAGTLADWFEIYNPGSDTVKTTAGRWFVTDDLNAPQKTALRGHNFPPHSYTIVFADSLLSGTTYLHGGFNLSKSGEDVGLFYQKDDGSMLEISSHTFGAQTAGKSEARLPDGTGPWSGGHTPTFAAPNL
jgi:hypothetical protein